MKITSIVQYPAVMAVGVLVAIALLVTVIGNLASDNVSWEIGQYVSIFLVGCYVFLTLVLDEKFFKR